MKSREQRTKDIFKASGLLEAAMYVGWRADRPVPKLSKTTRLLLLEISDALKTKAVKARGCPACDGTGVGPSGKCIYTGEIVDADCPTCGGTGNGSAA